MRRDELQVIDEIAEPPAPEWVRALLLGRELRVGGGSLGDHHLVGLQEITNIKHQGLEWFGLYFLNTGSSVLVERLLDEVVEQGAVAVLASVMVSHREVRRVVMRRLADTAIQRGLRDWVLLVAGGPQVTSELDLEYGLDTEFGRGTKGVDVARFLVDALPTKSREQR